MTAKIIGRAIDTTLSNVKKELRKRTFIASSELRNAALYVLSGQRSGRRYKVPNTYARQKDKSDGKMKKGVYYTASAPGESPANRLGTFRLSWKPHTYVEKSGNGFKAVASIESRLKSNKHLLGEILEHGTRRMLPRPYKQKIIDRAMPNIKKIYNKPYL